MNTATAPAVDNLTYAKNILAGEISSLIQPADCTMIEHLHGLILAADLLGLEQFLQQFSQNAEYLSLVVTSAGKHFAQLTTGLCVSVHAPGVILINAYHGDCGLIIHADGKPSYVVPIRTIWDGSIIVEPWRQDTSLTPDLVLGNCARTAIERLGRMKAKVSELPAGIDA